MTEVGPNLGEDAHMANIIPIRFDIYRGEQLVNTQFLEKETIKIGSQPSVDLRLDDPGISKMHALIERTANGFQIADLAGKGGTLVNGAAVTDRRALGSGDQVQVGPFRLVVSFQAAGGAVGVPGRRKKRKKKADELERRFLSERYAGGAGMLEIAVVWKGKVITQDQYEKSQAIVVGSGPSAKYRVEDKEVGDAFELLSPTGNTWELNITENMGGFVVVYPEHNGKVKFPIRDAITHNIIRSKGKSYSLPIDGNNRVKLTIGEVSFLIHYVSRQALKLAAVSERDRGVMWMAALAALAIALVGTGLVSYYPDRANALSASQNLSDAGFLKVVIAQKEKEKETKQEKLDDPEPEPEEVVEEKKDTKIEKVTAPSNNTNESKVSAPSNLSPSQSKSYKKAASVGVAKSASKLQSIAALGVGGGKGAGEAVAGLAGFAGDTGSGVAGLDMASSGLSGGEGGVGSMGGGGNVGGGIEGGGGKTGGGDYREAGGELKEKAVGKPQLKPADPSVGGGFDKQIIKRVVNQKKAEITQCYNKELQKKPDLKGKITMKWRILSSGNVGEVSVSSNEMGNDAVGNCLKGRIGGWKFPAPKSGSAVDVSYPFNFDSSK